MKIDTLKEGFKGKEWKRDTKHRIYIVGPSGEVGYYDITKAEFNLSPKANINFGLCDEENACLSIQKGRGKKIYLGQLQEEIPDSSEARGKLQEAIKEFGNLTKNADNTRVEINLGPTVEFRVRGKSHWAKANLTVSVDGGKKPLDIEKLYDATSDMVSAMLDIEMDKLSQ